MTNLEINMKEIKYYEILLNHIFNYSKTAIYGGTPYINSCLYISSIPKQFKTNVFALNVGWAIYIDLFKILDLSTFPSTIFTILLQITVHELYHLNQYKIIYNNLNNDEIFNSIEKPVEGKTLQFITNNKKDIENMFGIDIDMDIISDMCNHPLYEIKSYQDNKSPLDFWLYCISCIINIPNNDMKQISDMCNGTSNYTDIKLNLINIGENDPLIPKEICNYIRKDNIWYAPSNDLMRMTNYIYNTIHNQYSISTKTEYDNMTIDILYTLKLLSPIDKTSIV